MWDIFPRGDVSALCAWLRANAADFVHIGSRVGGYLGDDAGDSAAPVLSQRFMLVERHRQVGRGEGRAAAVAPCRSRL